MNKRIFGILFAAVLVLTMGLVPAVLADNSPPDPPAWTVGVTLYAGQHNDVGTVYVSNDAQNLYVEYELNEDAISEGWVFTELHLAVAEDLADIPTNRAGDPVPGHFAHKKYFDDADEVTAHTFIIGLEDAGFAPADELLIAAHAVIGRSTNTETAWGDGERFVNRGNWGTYFAYTVFEEIPEYNLTIASTAGGSVTVPGEGTFLYEAGTVVNLVATPASGYRFVNWTGNVGTIANVNSASTTITMNGSYSITANFEEEGVVCATISPTTAQYDLANPGQVTTTITWNDATNIVSIHDGAAYLLGTDYTVVGNTLTILNAYLAGKLTTVDDSVVLTIDFGICTVSFTVTAIDTSLPVCATISPTTAQYDLANPGQVTTTITWNDASSITSIHDGAAYLTLGTDYTVVGNTLTILNAYLAGRLTTVGASVMLTIDFGICTATFTITAIDTSLPVRATISSTAGGSVTVPGEGTFTYDAGTVVNLVATPDAGYEFVNWTGNVGTIANVNSASTTITMNGSYSITANFEALLGVNIPDPNLEAAIREAIGKPTGPIYPSDLAGLTSLDASARNIADLTGLEYCTSLAYLYLVDNQISSISPLANLTSLIVLYLGENQISDISPLANLTNLEWLEAQSNQISDLSPLSNLTNLTRLELWTNQISDISPLVQNTGLGTGDYIDLRWNPLSSDSVSIYIPELEARGVTVDY